MSSFTSPTPQPFRDLVSEGTKFRSTLESEVWDDMANIVYSAIDPTTGLAVAAGIQTGPLAPLTIGCPVPTRLEIHAKLTIAESTLGPPSADVNWVVGESTVPIVEPGLTKMLAGTAVQLTSFGAVDVVPGVHTYAISLIASDDVELTNIALLIRRGRKPPEIGVV